MKILWDFDGTLFDTYPVYTKLMRDVLEEAYAEEEIYAQLKVSFGHAIEYFGITPEQMNQFRQKEDELSPGNMGPFPYIKDVLQQTTNVIMTHKEREVVGRIIEHHGMSKYFEEWVCGDDGYPRKPDPAAYRYLHKKYSLDLAVGDRELDVIPAHILGIKTCLFQNEHGQADEYLSNYADFFDVIKGV
ncbi:HAD-IA family hydrolase [Tuberibacillus sp. Marseille-P3662]|uniref:HAD-IA family hydrolase n=1 Tax=Tuberibacillus sp. Marseille-P3662 TaxID=1965358 RepID=UPI000A1CA8AF|nr:HAD-IA family hydrolase [Tuberibacillus sp. Marseille-P3662]